MVEKSGAVLSISHDIVYVSAYTEHLRIILVDRTFKKQS